MARFGNGENIYEKIIFSAKSGQISEQEKISFIKSFAWYLKERPAIEPKLTPEEEDVYKSQEELRKAEETVRKFDKAVYMKDKHPYDKDALSELVTVQVFFDIYRAEIAKGLLAENNIESVVLSDDLGGYRPDLSMGNVKLLVKDKDFAKAKAILEKITEEK